MGVSSFSSRLLKRLRERDPRANRRRASAPLRVRGLEKRIVLDATIAVGGGSVDISNVNTGTNVNVEQMAFNIDGVPGDEAVYHFELNGSGDWEDQFSNTLSGQVDLDGVAGPEAFVNGNDLYVSKTFLETNAGGLSVSGVGNGFLQMDTNVTTAGNQDYGVRMNLMTNVTLTGPNVTFTGIVNGPARDLKIQGNAVFGNDTADDVTVKSLEVTGTTTINTDSIVTTGTQTYTGAVTIGVPAGTATLATTDSAVLFGSSVDLDSNLTINAGTGAVTFTGAVNGGKTLNVNSTTDTIFNGLVGGVDPLTALTTNADGTTQIKGGGVHTTGDQNYNDDVRLGTGTQSLSGDDIHFFEEVDGLAAGQGDLLIANTNTVTFDKSVGSINDVASFKVSAVDITFGGTSVDVTGSAAESVHIVATGTLKLSAGFTVQAAFNGTGYEGVANTFTPRPAPGVADTALVELPAVPPTVTATTNLDGSATATVTRSDIGNTGEKGLRVYVDWGNTSDPANRYEGPDGWADGDGLGANTGDLDGINGVSNVSLTHTYTAAEVAAQQLVDSTFDVKYAVFQHEAIVIEAARLEQVGETPIGVAGGPLIVLTTTMVFTAAGPRYEPPPAATNPNLVNGLLFIEIAAPFGGGTVAVGGDSVDLSNFIAGTTVTVTQSTFDVNGDSTLDDVYVFELNTGTWNDGAVNLSGQVDLDGIAGAEAFVNGGFLYVSKTFLETNPGGLSITGDGVDPTILLATDITTVGDQDYLLADVELQTDVVLSSGAGDITFGQTVSGAFDLTINSTGTTTFEGTVNLASLTTDANGATVINGGSVETTGDQTYGDNVTLGADTTLTGGLITFEGTLTGNANTLDIAGDVIFGNEATDTVTGLDTLDVSGTSTINTIDISSTGVQTYEGTVTLGEDATLTSSQVTFNGQVLGGGNSLEILGDAEFGNAVGDTVTGLTTLEVTGNSTINTNEITSTGSQTYFGGVTLGITTTLTGSSVTFLGTIDGGGNSLTVDGGATFGDATGDTVSNLDSLHVTGATTIETSAISSTNGQTYDGTVALGENVTLTASLVTFNSPVVGGGNSLDIAGNAIFGDEATDTVTGLTTLDVSGTSQINTSEITSSGAQTYEGTVTLGEDVTLTGSLVTFHSQVAGGGNSLEIDGNAVFGNAVGDTVTGLDTLHVTGTTQINTSNVTSTDTQTYDGNVTLGTDVTLTASLVTFNGQVIGGGNSLDIDGDAVFGDEATDTVTGLDTLDVSGTSLINASEISSTNGQTYHGTVTLGENVTLTASTVTFNDQVLGGGNALEVDGNAVFGNGVTDTVAGLDTLHVTGTSLINTSDISSTNGQTYDGNVTLSTHVTLTASTVTFNGQVAGGGNELEIAGNAVFGNDAADTVTGLDTLHVIGTSAINTSGISSTNGQTYDGNVTLGTDVTLSASLVTFNGQMIGGGNSLDIVADAVFGDETTDTVTGLDTLDVSGTSLINTSDISSTNGQTYEGAVTLGTDVTLTASTVTFNDQVLGGGNSLEIDGNAVFGNAAADTVTGLDTLLVTGTSEINTSDITSTGGQTYGGDVTLGTDVTLTATLVTFNGQVIGGANSLEIDGDAIFGDAAGDTVAGLDTLLVTGVSTINTSAMTSTGTQTYEGNVTLGTGATLTASTVTFHGEVLGGGNSLEVDGNAVFGNDVTDTVTGLDTLHVTGTSLINTSDISSTNGQTYEGAVTLGTDVTLTASLVTFHDQVIGGGNSLEIDGNAVFGNAATDTVTGLDTLLVTGTSAINTSNVTSTGSQTYDGNVTLGTDVTLAATLVTFNGQVIGGGNSLDIAGDAVFGDEDADTVTGLDTLDVSGTTLINTEEISSTNGQTYDGDVTLGTDVTLTASLVTFNDDVIGQNNSLTIDGNAIFGDNPADSVTGLASLLVTGTATFNAGVISTTGTQTYDGDVTLTTDTVLTATLVTFNGKIIGGANELEIDGNAIFGNEATDTVTGLDTLLVSGDATINTTTISSTNGQTYDGTVTLGTDVTLTASLVTFNGAVVGGGNSLDIAGNVIFGDEAADTVTGLDTLDVSGTATINTTDISSAGAQTYEGTVTLGEDVTLTASQVTFNGQVVGGGNSLEVDGNAIFGNAAGDTVTGLDTLVVTGTSAINTSEITSTGSQTYGGNVTLGTDVALTASLVTFNGQIIGGTNSLEIDGDAVFGNEATDTVTGLDTLLVTGTSTINTTHITSTGTQTYDGEATLGENVTLTASQVTFNGAVVGDGNSLDIAGNAVFGNEDADTVTGLDTVHVSGTSLINTSNVSSTNGQTYDGNVTLGTDVTLTASLVTFNGQIIGGGNSLDIAGNAIFGNAATDTVTGLDTLHVSGTTAINTSSVSSTNGQTYDGTVTLGTDATLTASLVTFNGAVVGGANSLDIAGNAVFGNDPTDTVTGLDTLHVSGTSAINTSNISSTNGQKYDGNVTLGTDVTLTASLVTFNGQVIGGGNALDILGNAIFGNATGDTVTGLDTLHVSGTSAINTSEITSTNGQTYDGNVTLGTDVALTGSLITFNGQVLGGGNELEIDGNAVFGNDVTDTVTGLDTLHVTGTSQINTSNITSTGTQTYDGNVTLGTDVTLTASTVLFNGQIVGGANSLDIAGNAVFGNAAGDTVTGLDTLHVSGTTLINTSDVSSTNGQTYDGAVTLGTDVTLTASLVTFNDQVIGGGNSLDVAGNAIFGNAVGDTVTGLDTLHVTGTSQINTSNVTSTGTQIYDGNVTLGTDVTLTASTVTFNSLVLGGGNSLEIAGNAVFGNAVGDTVTGLDTLHVTGTSQINTSHITSTGFQTYDGNVTLGANTTLTGSTITFNGQVIGVAHSLDLVGDAVFGNAVGDTVTGLTTLHVTGISQINTSNITSTGTQIYDGSVTLGANTTLTGSTVTFNSQVIGVAHSLDVVGNAVFGNAVGDTVTGLTTLHVTGTSQINTSNITSTGTQTYDGNVTLGTDVTLTASTVTFNSQVLGGGNTLDIVGNAVFGDAVGDTVTGLDTLHVTGTSQINTSNITSTGTQIYDGNVTLGANATLTGSVITFNGQVIGVVHSLDVVGNAVFGDAIGDTVTGLTTLHVTGTSQINTSNITSTGTQIYDGNVTLGANTTLTGSTVTFNSQVIGVAHSLAVVGNAVFGDAAGDTVTGLTTLSVSGATTINTNTVTSSGSQTYTGAVTIGTPAGLATLTTTNSPVFFGSTTTLQSDLTVTTGNGNITWTGAINGGFDLVANTTGTTIFNGLVGNLTPLSSVTTNAGGVTQINGGGVVTTGNQLYGDDVELGPGIQSLSGDEIHFFGGVDGVLDRQGDLNITNTNSVFFDKPIGAIRDPGSVKVRAVDITFEDDTYIEVGKSAAESVHIVATGTLVLPTGFVVRAAFNGGVYDGVANTFLPRPAPGVPDTALVELPADRPIFSSQQNLDQSATGTIELPIGNAGERGLRVFVDWGDTVSQENRFEGPGWADGDGLGDNNDPGDLFAIEGGSTISLTHTYTEAEVKAQLAIDNDFDVKYAVYQHEAIVIEAARVEQGAESLGTPGGDMTVLTTTMVYRNAADPRFEPPPPGTVPDLVNGTAAIQLAPPAGGVPFEIPTERPNVAFAPLNDAPPLDPIVTFQQVTKDDSSSSSPVVGRQQRFVLRLLSPDPTAPPLAEVDLPPDSFNAKNLQLLFKELPDGAYEIDLLLGENTERPILRFDIRQGRPVVPQESLDGGQLRLEDIEETLKKNAAEPATGAKTAEPSMGVLETAPGDSDSFVTESAESAQPDSEVTADGENSSLEVRPAVTMSSLLEWKLRRREAVREGSLTLASRLARRVCS